MSKNDRTPKHEIEHLVIDFFEEMVEWNKTEHPVPEIAAEQIQALPGYKKVFEDIDLELSLRTSILEEKTLSLSGALFRVKDEDLFGYLDDLYTIERIIESHRPETVTNGRQWDEWSEAYQSVQKLKSYANTELLERIQVYRTGMEEATAENHK